MSKLFDILAQTAALSQDIQEGKGRRFGLFAATVASVSDPINKRRIRVTTGSKGGLTTTDWLFPMRLIPHYDPPMPKVGDTVVCAFLDGNPHDGVWLGNFINETNPEDSEQSDPLNDNTQLIPGDNRETTEGFHHRSVGAEYERDIAGHYKSTVGETEDRRTEMDITVSCGLGIKLINDAGAFIWLTPTGAVVIQSAAGQKIILGGASAPTGVDARSDFLMSTGGTEGIWDMGDGSIRIVNAQDFTLSSGNGYEEEVPLSGWGNSVTTIGATDDRGDDLVTRGW